MKEATQQLYAQLRGHYGSPYNIEDARVDLDDDQIDSRSYTFGYASTNYARNPLTANLSSSRWINSNVTLFEPMRPLDPLPALNQD